MLPVFNQKLLKYVPEKFFKLMPASSRAPSGYAGSLIIEEQILRTRNSKSILKNNSK